MKRILFGLLFSGLIVLVGCSKDEEPANLEITVSYFYNTYQGYKPDVGATVVLYNSSDVSGYCADSTGYIGHKFAGFENSKGEDMSVNYRYDQEADVNGVVKISGITPGKYLVAVCSKGRWLYSVKTVDFGDGEDVVLVKNFGYKNEYQSSPETW